MRGGPSHCSEERGAGEHDDAYCCISHSCAAREEARIVLDKSIFETARLRAKEDTKNLTAVTKSLCSILNSQKDGSDKAVATQMAHEMFKVLKAGEVDKAKTSQEDEVTSAAAEAFTQNEFGEVAILRSGKKGRRRLVRGGENVYPDIADTLAVDSIRI